MTPLPTLEETISAYKHSLTNWVERATNDLPPNNQKGRIVQEIDAEFKAAIQRLFAAERLDELKILAQMFLGDERKTLKRDNLRGYIEHAAAELQQLIEVKEDV